MVIQVNQETFTKFIELKNSIVDETGKSISNKRLISIMIDTFYQKLLCSPDDKKE